MFGSLGLSDDDIILPKKKSEPQYFEVDHDVRGIAEGHISLKEGDKLELIMKTKNEGWVHVRNKAGTTGIVKKTCLSPWKDRKKTSVKSLDSVISKVKNDMKNIEEDLKGEDTFARQEINFDAFTRNSTTRVSTHHYKLYNDYRQLYTATLFGGVTKIVGRYFNKPLRKISEENDGDCVPYFINILMKKILEDHVERQGIFRRNGDKFLVEEVVEILDDEDEDDLKVHEIEEALENKGENLAALIKLFLCFVPEPICTFDLYDEFVELGKKMVGAKSKPSEELEALRINLKDLLVKKLPKENFVFWRSFAHFFDEIGNHSKKNLMTHENLTLVFASCFFRPKVLDLQTFYDSEPIAVMFCETIKNPNLYFP